ncbi:family 16 glycoside hydrolase [Patescibacteria group bacterium]
MMRTKHRTTDRRGFTLMESLITIALIAMLLAVYLTVLGSIFFMRRLQFNIQGANFVQEEIEVLRSLDFTELTNRTDGNFLGLPFTRGDWSVEVVDASGQGNTMSLPAAETALIGETGMIVVPGNYKMDFTYTAKVRVDDASPAGWDAGIGFRYRDAENHYRFRITNGGLALDKVDGGTVSTLWSQSTTLLTDTWYTLEVIANGSEFILKRDGVTLTTYNDTTFATGDLTLMTMDDAIAAFDDVVITESSMTTYDFSSYALGDIPPDWERLSAFDLPLGAGTVTIADHLGNSDIKEVTVTVSWMDGLFAKSMSGVSLIAQ